jgi:hypothetical protein
LYTVVAASAALTSTPSCRPRMMTCAVAARFLGVSNGMSRAMSAFRIEEKKI